MNNELINLDRKVKQYKEVLNNTHEYRKIWHESLKDKITNTLKGVSEEVGLDAEFECRNDLENLEAIVMSLGNVRSGMSQEVASNIRRDLIKHNGSLIYQQLFNGKILVLINYPFIENYGQPQPPKTIAIYRPEELKDPYFVRHIETFMQEVMMWEDYDDDIEEPNQRIGFKLNFQGMADGAPNANG
ncbi:MAG: hypothetical protein R2879_09595 [Saprospiraceae bacterium]